MILLTVPVLAAARAVTESIQHKTEKPKELAKPDEEYALSNLPKKGSGSEEKESTEEIVSPTVVEEIEVS